MSTMRKGLETWLREDCFINGHNILTATTYMNNIIDHLDRENVDAAKQVSLALRSWLSQNTTLDTKEVQLFNDKLDDLFREPGIYLHKIVEMMDMIEARALEKTVECQCGKTSMVGNTSVMAQQESNDYELWLMSKIAAVAPKEDVDELRSLNPNTGNLEWHYEHYLHSDTPFTDYINTRDKSTLRARLVSINEVVQGPCKCTAGKELCWHPGFAGTLSKQQKDKYCANWETVHGSPKAQGV